MSFDKIIGNDDIKNLFERILRDNHLLHSYLFIGIEGIGKKIFAREFAKKILCINKEESQDCISCIKWDSNNHPDFMQIQPEDGGTLIKIEQIREMQEKIAQKPITSSNKVYIIDDSDCMTKEAQNCLLKTLEEPPEYAIIILISSNESKLLNTIKSRCMKIYFKDIEENQIEKYIKENIDTNYSKQLITKCNGSLGKALNIQEKKEIYEKIDNIIKNIEKQDLITLLNNAEVLYKEKEMIQQILEYINTYLYTTKEIKKINAIQYVEETKRRLLTNSNYDMSIDYLLFNLWSQIH